MSKSIYYKSEVMKAAKEALANEVNNLLFNDYWNDTSAEDKVLMLKGMYQLVNGIDEALGSDKGDD